MKDTFTLADLANFKLEPPAAEPAKVATQNATESSTEAPVTGDVEVETSAETTPATAAKAVSEPEAVPSDAPKDEKYIPKDRFDEVIDERNALRRFNEYLLAKEQSPIATASAPAPAQQADAKPTLENCNFDVAKYEESMTAWTQKQVENARTQGAQLAETKTAQTAFDERMAVYAKANPSVVTVLGNPNLPKLAKEAAVEVVKSELGPQILHYLGANPDVAARIARKPEAAQAADIGRIEGDLRAKSKTPQKTPQITRAPSPPTPTQGRGNTPSVDPSKMSTKEWIAWDRAQELERRRARKGARSA